MAIEKVDIEHLKSQINIVDYVKQYVDLHFNGVNYIGLCPFHKEDTPSFVVNESKQLYKCFGCHVGSDIIGFIREYHHYTFSQAIAEICRFINIDSANIISIPSALYHMQQYNKKRKPLLRTERMELNTTCFDGITFDPVEEWIREGIAPAVLQEHKVGYDKVSNTIAFPIYDMDGKLISLKHRTLDENYKKNKKPKYIYSIPIGQLDFFYWYHKNKNSIEQQQEIILVEGEKSVMKLESWGITNAVATMTSNVSPHQIRLLKEMNVKNVVIAFDNDKKLDKIKDTFHALKSYKNVYFLHDFSGKEAILDEKDAPCDKGRKNWLKFYEMRERIRKW